MVSTVSCSVRAYFDISDPSDFIKSWLQICNLRCQSLCHPVVVNPLTQSQFRAESLLDFQRKKKGEELMDWGSVSKAWDKWASTSVGSSGLPLKAALLINYEPGGPSRLLPIIAEQEGLKVTPLDLNEFVEFVKRKQYQSETFFIAADEYMVTSIYESWFCARSLNSAKPAGEGAIVMLTAAFLLVGLYEGSVDSASRAMSAVDLFAWQIGRRNL